MNIVIVGLNHRTAPVEIREKFALPDERLPEVLGRLQACEGVAEGVILSTCNRVEVCAVVRETLPGVERLRRFFAGCQSTVSFDSLVSHLYCHVAEDAIRHLFRVASSLDSMVVGEPQILGQVKSAFDLAMVHKATGVVLNRLFRKAISVAKKVRTQTRIAESAVSVGFAAVELAEKVLGPLGEKAVLLLGSGEIATLSARNFAGRGVRKMMIAGRNQDRAADLAAQLGGRAVPFERFLAEMVEADIVLCSTGAAEYLVHARDLAQVIQARKNQPIILIDLSVPRNIDPRANEIDNVFLYDIDDLERVIAGNLEERRQEAERAERIVLEEIEGMTRWLKALDVTPTIVALRERSEAIRRAELEKALAKMKGLDETQRAAVEALTSAIVNKLLHTPFVTLRQEAGSADAALYIDATRRLFHLDSDSQAGSVEPEASNRIEPEASNIEEEKREPGPERGGT